jgi:hypothetical protein
MAKLAVTEVRCDDPQERLGDELYVNIDGYRRDLLDGFEFNDGRSWSDNDHQRFSNVVSGNVGTSARVTLWEDDVVGDDRIAGRSLSYWGGGGRSFEFDSSDGSAEYTITFDWV